MVDVVALPNPILKKKIELISPQDLKKGVFSDLIEQMKKAMKERNGVGLAANQVGQDIQLFIIDPELAKDHDVPDVLINPEILEYSQDSDEMEEGCLSIPQYYVPIMRSKKIKFKALDIEGNKIRIRARGFLARVLQHETDHLNGTTIKERVKK